MFDVSVDLWIVVWCCGWYCLVFGWVRVLEVWFEDQCVGLQLVYIDQCVVVVFSCSCSVMMWIVVFFRWFVGSVFVLIVVVIFVVICEVVLVLDFVIISIRLFFVVIVVMLLVIGLVYVGLFDDSSILRLFVMVMFLKFSFFLVI